MKITVNVHWPKNMDVLEEKAGEVIAEILVKKLSSEELELLIEILKDDSIDIRM